MGVTAHDLDDGRLAEKLGKVLAAEGLTLDVLTVKHDAKGVTVTVKASASEQLSLLGELE
jgi:hypothetical protein